MRNIQYNISENFEIHEVCWTRKFIQRIFKKNFESKNHFWKKTSFPLSPTEDLFAGNSVQTILNFYIPRSPSLQEILVNLQAVIYPNSKEELSLNENATKATLKMIGEQSQTLILKGRCMSFYGHKDNFCYVNRFTILGSQNWPFEFQRAMVHWDAYSDEAEADILLKIDYFMDLSKVETATWMNDGQLRIPTEDVELDFDLNLVLENEKLPLLSKLENEVMEISSDSIQEERQLRFVL